MTQKLIVPVVALILALLTGLGLWLVLRDKDPKPQIAANQPVDPDGPPVREKGNVNERDYNPAIVAPDPVVMERPQPFRVPDVLFRIEVSGRVVDDGNVPVADAQVRFIGEGALQDINGAGYADGNGRYTLVAWSPRGARPGAGQRQARVVAYAGDDRQGISAIADLPAEDKVEMPDVVLAGVSEIRGRILDESAAPATGVVVFVRSATAHESIPSGLRVPRVQHAFISSAVTTDGRGEFRIKGLRPGRYQLNVERSYFGESTGPLEVEVMPSGAAWVEPSLRSAQYVRGKVVDSDGLPVAGAVVRASATGAIPPPDPKNQPLRLTNAGEDAFRESADRNSRAANLRGGPGSMAITDEQGRFGFFALADTTWQISTLVGDAKAVLEDVKPNQADLTLTVQSDTAMSGVVRDAETGLPIESFDLRVLKGAEDRVSPFERVSVDRALPWHPRGEWRVVNPKSANMIRVSAIGYSPALVRIAELQAGERRTNLEVRLLPQCALTVTPRHNGERLELEPVLLLFENGLAYEASTDLQGRVRFPAIAPTRYSVRVILRDGTRLSGTLDVPAKSSASLEIELTPSAEK